MREAAPSVYIVDDDQAVRHSIGLLAASFGWRVRTFASSSACLNAVLDERPDCLLMDLHMPGMSGPALQRALSILEVGVPVIVITGNPHTHLLTSALAAGVRQVLAKPVDQDDLRRAVERVVGAED